MSMFQGGDCLEGLPLGKMIGFAWTPWSGPRMGLELQWRAHLPRWEGLTGSPPVTGYVRH